MSEYVVGPGSTLCVMYAGREDTILYNNSSKPKTVKISDEYNRIIRSLLKQGLEKEKR